MQELKDIFKVLPEEAMKEFPSGVLKTLREEDIEEKELVDVDIKDITNKLRQLDTSFN